MNLWSTCKCIFCLAEQEELCYPRIAGEKNVYGPNVSHWYLQVILRSHSTVGPVLAVESILQVNLGLPNQIIRSNQIMVKYCHSEF